MEIDLKELKIFEQKLNEKRSSIKQNTANDDNSKLMSTPLNDCDKEIDEIDEYLNQLAINLKTKNQTTNNNDDDVVVVGCCSNSKNSHMNSNCIDEPSSISSSCSSQNDANNKLASPPSQQPLPLLMYWLLGIIFFINTVQSKICKPLFVSFGLD